MPFTFRNNPTWHLHDDIVCEYNEYPKKGSVSDHVMRCLYNEHVQQAHSNRFCIYTDGAKNGNGVGCAAVSLSGSKYVKMMPESSIFTAELSGILCGLQIVNSNTRTNFIIFTDSRSASNQSPITIPHTHSYTVSTYY